MIYRTVNCDIWRDPWFHDLAPASKCLFVYLFTNPSVSPCGAMELSVGQIAFDTGMPAKRVEAELVGFGERVLWLPDENTIVVRNFYKHQRKQSSGTFAAAAKKAMTDLPPAAIEWLIGVYPELRDTLPLPHPYPIPTLGGKETALATATEEEGSPLPPKGGDPRGCRIPDDFALDDDLRSWAAKSGFGPAETEHHTENFTNYWRGESGARARKKDWRAAWRTWMGRETPGKWKPAGPPGSNGNGAVDWNDPVQVEAYRLKRERENLARLV